MKKNYLVSVFFIFMFLTMNYLSFSQGYPELSTRSGKAKKYYMEAMKAFNIQNYDIVIGNLNTCIEYDSSFVEAWLLLADVQSIKKQYNDAIVSYKKALKINPEFFPNAWFLMANIQLNAGYYNDSYDSYNNALKLNRYSPEKKDLIYGRMKRCEFGNFQLTHPVPFDPKNLGDSINGTDNDYINAITADDEILYVTIKAKRYDPLRESVREEEDFYVSVKKSGVWRNVKNIGEPVNTAGNEGALCISADGMDMYFAGCNRPDGKGSCDLYHAQRIGSTWSIPENMGIVINTEKWDTQPSIAPDGKTIYFVSNRAGGKGNSDIYKAIRDENGKWGNGINLGDSINTSEMEMTPFIHPDGQTLYFASQGHLGMGGFDLFVSRMKPDGSWTKPKNLGYPINTVADEINLIVNAKGNMAFLSSDKPGGLGQNDIYSFELYQDIRPSMVSYVKGVVFNSVDKRPVKAAFELIDLSTGEVIVRSHSEPAGGEFMVTLPPKRDYALHVSSPGYLFYSDNFSLKDLNYADQPFLLNIPLHPLKAGEIVVLKNVFFDTDRFELLNESRIELDRLVSLLRNNPMLSIEVSGHTDDQGSDEHNQELSANRARVVYEYLVSAAIPATRLKYKGYGEKSPVADNKTEEGRKQNRRTEFRVLNPSEAGGN